MKNLQSHIDQECLEVIDTKLPGTKLKGLYIDGTIVMDTSIETESEYRCVLSEELGHHYTSDGNIIDYKSIESQRQEDRANRWALNEILPLEAFVEAYNHGCRNKFEIADFLFITEDFLEKAVNHYKSKHGGYVSVGEHAICFDPLGIMRKF